MSPQVMTMRIGELSRRVGVSTHVLRAWESRYGLLRPVRSSGGYRLYGPADERRVLVSLTADGQALQIRAAGVPHSLTCRVLGMAEGTAPTPAHQADLAQLRTQLQALVQTLAQALDAPTRTQPAGLDPA